MPNDNDTCDNPPKEETPPPEPEPEPAKPEVEETATEETETKPESEGEGTCGCNSGEGADEAEIAESEELVDEQAKFRDICRERKDCAAFFTKLNTCNDRVNSKSKTAETCFEEVVDYVHCVDHCAAKKYFPLLK